MRRGPRILSTTTDPNVYLKTTLLYRSLIKQKAKRRDRIESVTSNCKIAPSTEPSPTTPSTSACNKQLLGGLDANTKKELMTSAEEMPPPPPTMSVSPTTSMMKQQGKSGLVRQHSISAFKTNHPEKSNNPFTSKSRSGFETTSMSSDCGPSSDDLYKKVFGASEPENSHEPNYQPDNQKESPQDTHNQNTVRSKA